MDPITLPPPVLVADPAGLDSLVHSLAQYPVVAVDTESNSLHAYRERVCLIQFSTPAADYIVDPLKLADLQPLAPLFARPDQQKIFHAAEYDLLCLARDYQFEFENIFDTMSAARTLGWPQVGLAAILDARFGVTMNKKHQRADWGRRPLTQEQLDYARLDTHYLLALREIQLQALAEAGRTLEAHEEFARLSRVRPDPADGTPDPLAFWRVTGAYGLTPVQAAVLKALFAYRQEQARLIDRPPFKVMGESTLVEIARRTPRDLDGLQELAGLAPAQVQRHGPGLLRAVQHGLQGPPQRAPQVEREPEEVRERYDSLRKWRKEKAQARGVESDVIVPRSALWDLARRAPRTVGELTNIVDLGPWRRETYGDEILKVLSAH
jgi:ribonuclease D